MQTKIIIIKFNNVPVLINKRRTTVSLQVENPSFLTFLKIFGQMRCAAPRTLVSNVAAAPHGAIYTGRVSDVVVVHGPDPIWGQRQALGNLLFQRSYTTKVVNRRFRGTT